MAGGQRGDLAPQIGCWKALVGPGQGQAAAHAPVHIDGEGVRRSHLAQSRAAWRSSRLTPLPEGAHGYVARPFIVTNTRREDAGKLPIELPRKALVGFGSGQDRRLELDVLDPLPEEVIDRLREAGHGFRHDRHPDLQAIEETAGLLPTQPRQEPLENGERARAAKPLRPLDTVEAQAHTEVSLIEEPSLGPSEQEPIRAHLVSDARPARSERLDVTNGPAEKVERQEGLAAAEQ